MEDRIVDIDELIEDPNNARSHDKRNLDTVEKSFEKFGPFRSLAMDGDGIIRAGNASLKGAKAAGVKKVRKVAF